MTKTPKRIIDSREDCTALEIFDEWENDLPPTLFQIGTGELSKVEIGPGLVTIVGAPTSLGKSALLGQWILEAMRHNTELRCAIVSVEMGPFSLLDRQLSRLSGVPMTDCRYRRFADEDEANVRKSRQTIRALADRWLFIRASQSIDQIAQRAEAFGANLLILDYLQRLRAPGYSDSRLAMNTIMSTVRQIADAGVAVIGVSALCRQVDETPLTLASFRESSEIEYGTDNAYILQSDGAPNVVRLRHLKSRHSELHDVRLRFDSKYMEFSSV